MTQIWHPHSTVACICEHNGLFLMVRETIQGKQVYNQPAGHIEDNESIVEATLRETLEETGHKVSAQSVTGIYRFRVSSQLTFLRFSLHCTLISKVTDQIDPDINSVHWMSYQDIVHKKDQLRSPLVLSSIDDYKKDIQYPLALINNDY